MMETVKNRTAGRIDLERQLDAMTDADFDRVSITARAGQLIAKPMLLIGASRDTTAPLELCHETIVEGLEAAGLRHLTAVVLEADHQFLTKRVALARLVVSWLRSECGF
jgi:hypothetical protein